MIPVVFENEPSLFDVRIRQKGIAWCQRNNISLNCPLPEGKKLKEYWRICLPAMRKIYHCFCAYTNILINPGEGTIDHFLPKNKYPKFAYEWTNYRLALPRINSRKKDCEDVLDPFDIKDGWFQLDLITGFLYADPELPFQKRTQILQTINRLQLNDSMYKQYRLRYIDDYIHGKISIQLLERDAPYIFREMRRQNMF
ncbi:MAG: hypothetical protein Q4G69_05625 [Planctomycetia bacterium]|nr:hypothetical protein [Planctomycetia bacterium]